MSRRIRTRATRIKSYHHAEGEAVQVSATGRPAEIHRRTEAQTFNRDGYLWLEVKRGGFEATLFLSVAEARSLTRALEAAIADAVRTTSCAPNCYHCDKEPTP